MIRLSTFRFICLIAFLLSIYSNSYGAVQAPVKGDAPNSIPETTQEILTDHPTMEKEQRALGIANSIINWSAMILSGIAIILTVVTVVISIIAFLGITEFSKIKQIQNNMEVKIDEFSKVINEINDIKSTLTDNFQRLIEEIYYFNEGRREYYKGNYTTARSILYRAIDINPQNTHAYYYISQAYRRDDNIEKSKFVFQKILNIEPNNFWAYYGLARLYAKNNPHKAVEYFKKCLELDTNNIRALTSLGVLYSSINDIEKAIDYLRRAYEIEKDAKTAFNLGLLYFGEADKQLANWYFDECKHLVHMDLDKARFLHWSYLRLGIIDGLNGDLESCKKFISEGLKYNNTKSVKLAFKLRVLYLKEHQPKFANYDQILDFLT